MQGQNSHIYAISRYTLPRSKILPSQTTKLVRAWRRVVSNTISSPTKRHKKLGALSLETVLNTANLKNISKIQYSPLAQSQKRFPPLQCRICTTIRPRRFPTLCKTKECLNGSTAVSAHKARISSRRRIVSSKHRLTSCLPYSWRACGSRTMRGLVSILMFMLPFDKAITILI